jgi:hypothetical protein
MYLKITNGVLQSYSLQQLRQDNPNTSFPEAFPNEMLAGYDVYPVSRPEIPEYDFLAWAVVDGEFTQDENGNWSMGYKLEKLPLDIASENVRSFRNQKLSESDWTQVADSPVDKQAWATYRQALRDITAQDGFPLDIHWPTL